MKYTAKQTSNNVIVIEIEICEISCIFVGLLDFFHVLDRYFCIVLCAVWWKSIAIRRDW